MSLARILLKALTTLLLAIGGILLACVLLLVVGTIYADHVQVLDRKASSPRGGHYVPAYDCEMFVQEAGPAGAPVVVFIPGTGAWSEMWRPYMNQVAALGYHAIAIDLPPFGYSVPPPTGDYSKPLQARRVMAALDSMNVRTATFVAHSIGSAPLMEALLSEPQRATGAILVSPALGLDSGPPGTPESLLHHVVIQPWFDEPLTGALLTNPMFTTTLVKHFVVERDRVNEGWVNLYREQFRLEGSYRYISHWIPALLAARTQLKSDTPEAYRQIGFPVTLIWGRDDFITPLSQGEHLQQLIPQASLLLLPGGHVPMIEEPEAFGADLAKALEEQRGGGASR